MKKIYCDRCEVEMGQGLRPTIISGVDRDICPECFGDFKQVCDRWLAGHALAFAFPVKPQPLPHTNHGRVPRHYK